MMGIDWQSGPPPIRQQLRGGRVQEKEQVYQAALDAIRGGQAACILTLIASEGSTPRRAGAKMLLRANGSTVGTIGGGAFEQAALEDARSALTDGESRVVGYSLRGDDEDDLGTCGGTAKVYLEVLQPRPTLLILGAGHVAQPLAAFGHLLGFRTVVVDDRAEFANPERFPHADSIVVVPFSSLMEKVAVTHETFAVVVTRNHEFDAVALRELLASPARYVGMIGSQNKVRTVFETLMEEGLPRQRLAQVRSPIGLKLGGQTPAEIALSIMAEIVMVQHDGNGEPLSERSNPLRAAVNSA
jgi:xanthine dehydrogenase accessory factor